MPLELVHSDLAEANVPSIGGGKYVLTFKDDATSHGIVFILANKQPSTVLKAFKGYQAWTERQSEWQIKELRVDCGKEYMGEMFEYIKSQGIEYNPTAGYSPQSNGVAERMDRTLFEAACTMLDAAGAPLELWGEAVFAARHIQNRLPFRMLGKTPHEAWTGKKPTVGHIRKWGCKVYRHINKKTGRTKLDKKSMAGFLVGYESKNIYRIYYPDTKEFKILWDVIFSENQFSNLRHAESEDQQLELNGRDAEENEMDGDVQASAPHETSTPILLDQIVVQSLRWSQKSLWNQEPTPSKAPNCRTHR